MRRLSFILLIFIAGGHCVAEENARKMSAGVGFFYSEGVYQDDDTSTLASLPFFFKVQNGMSSLKIASNLYRFRREDQQTNDSDNTTGLGNVYLSAKQLYQTGWLIPYIDIEGKLKTPMPSAINGLETGGFDFKFSSTAYYWASKNWFTGGLAYRWRGSELRNTFSLALGVSRPFSQILNAGARLIYEQAIQENSKAKLEQTIYLTWKAQKKTKYTFYYAKGFRDQRLNWASGLQVSHHW